ncbi:dihydrofolate reductase-like [Paramacrobiotus metropolitanus]|uniref:dihydrofolate reductase-like n=1 Tax=Paramacrobiotus metropolitanus TaxID=2943436 RepID=UPI0024456E2A|nr:dihydrofolate reductase-like [Paramacrobiotus metropolitanus]
MAESSTDQRNTDIRLNIIVAADAKRGIGQNGTLPWSLPKETNYYHGMINSVSPGKQNAIIIGRITYASIHDPRDYEKLLKIVVTRGAAPEGAPQPNVRYAVSFEDALEVLRKEMKLRDIETVWSLGGSKIYQETLDSPYLHRIYLTNVLAEFPCDTFFPEFDKSKFNRVTDERVDPNVQTDKGVQFQVEIFEKIRS